MSALTHLQRLEAEAIHIMREVVAETRAPVMLYSAGKDSAVMLHLARKAFHPSAPPFPLLHVDTTWKFGEMYAVRDKSAADAGMELLVWQNAEAKERGINPFDQWGVELGKTLARHFGRWLQAEPAGNGTPNRATRREGFFLPVSGKIPEAVKRRMVNVEGFEPNMGPDGAQLMGARLDTSGKGGGGIFIFSPNAISDN